MFVAAVRADLLLPEQVRSLKERRGIVNPLMAGLRRTFEVTRRRLRTGPAGPGPDRCQCGVRQPGHAQAVLDGVERWLSDRPEVELLSIQRRLFGLDD